MWLWVYELDSMWGLGGSQAELYESPEGLWRSSQPAEESTGRRRGSWPGPTGSEMMWSPIDTCFFFVGKTYEHIWQCVKTLYPCSSHQNSWDLWMFIPLKMVLIGIDPYPYTNLIGESFFIISHVAHRCSQIISTFFLRTVLRRHAEGYGGTSCHPGTAAGFLGTNHRRMMWGSDLEMHSLHAYTVYIYIYMLTHVCRYLYMVISRYSLLYYRRLNMVINGYRWL